MAVLHLTKDNFDSVVGTATKPVLVDFSAAWCGPCKMLAPIIDELGAELTDAIITKVDIDEEPELAQKFSVMSIPTLIVLKDGEITNQSLGFKPKQAIIDMLK